MKHPIYMHMSTFEKENRRNTQLRHTLIVNYYETWNQTETDIVCNPVSKFESSENGPSDFRLRW